MIYFNFLNAPDGGGYQNSISFLKTALDIGYHFDNTVVLCIKGTSIESLCLENNVNVISCGVGPIRKIVFEMLISRQIEAGDVVFSIFGPPILFSSGISYNVGGMAISNVFYPEVDFWSYLSFGKKILKKLKDRYRVARYKKLDVWIFETDLLKRKAVEEFGYPRDNCFVVKMTPSVQVALDNVKYNCYQRVGNSDNIKLLFLSGPNPNKRLHLLPYFLEQLNMKSLVKFDVILTLPDGEYLRKILELSQDLGVDGFLVNIGPVSSEDVATVIDRVDAVCNFSVLESFSNNCVEAWAMDKPLFITDACWSRESCKEAAFYIDVENYQNGVATILDAFNNPEKLEAVVCQGKSLLNEYPTAVEKATHYLSIIDSSQSIKSISRFVRRGIHK